jgi:hypothetical protein
MEGKAVGSNGTRAQTCAGNADAGRAVDAGCALSAPRGNAGAGAGAIAIAANAAAIIVDRLVGALAQVIRCDSRSRNGRDNRRLRPRKDPSSAAGTACGDSVLKRRATAMIDDTVSGETAGHSGQIPRLSRSRIYSPSDPC